MTELVVSPAILRQLADEQEAAAGYAEDATATLNGVDTVAWYSHGAFSIGSSIGFDTLEESRRAAGAALVNASNGLAAKLDDAAKRYESADAELSTNMDKQMVDG